MSVPTILGGVEFIDLKKILTTNVKIVYKDRKFRHILEWI